MEYKVKYLAGLDNGGTLAESRTFYSRLGTVIFCLLHKGATVSVLA